MIDFGGLFSGAVPKMINILADAMERDPDSLDQALREWKKKRAQRKPLESPPRPDRDPGISLGILSTSPHE